MSQNPFGGAPQNPYQAPATSGKPGAYGQAGANPGLEKEISAQAVGSLVVGIISLFCFGIILAPFAIYRGKKAMTLIDSFQVGHQHRGTAMAGFVIGIISLVFNVLLVGLWALLICGSMAAQEI